MDDIPESSRPTLLLEAWAQGDQAAFNELLRSCTMSFAAWRNARRNVRRISSAH
jgi:hypothetical protein